MTYLLLAGFGGCLIWAIVQSYYYNHLLKDNEQLNALCQKARKLIEEQLASLEKFNTENSALKKELEELQNKFKKNPSFEYQQLLKDLMSGHALFHIETINPENILIRRN